MTVRGLTSLLALALLATAGPAWCHELWLEPARGGFELLRGHRPEERDAHDGSELFPVEEVCLAVGFDRAGAADTLERVEDYPLDFGEYSAVVTVRVCPGYWTKTPYGTVRKPKAQVAQAVRSWLSRESVKFIGAWSSALAQPLTEDLELVPLANPLDLKKGGKLRLVVTLEGSPIEGAVVSYDGKPRGRTGRDGRVNIRIKRTGLQVVQASYTTALESDKADEVVRTATLNFIVEESR